MTDSPRGKAKREKPIPKPRVKNPRGRGALLLSPEVHARVVEGYRLGLWPHQIAAYARVAGRTLRNWLLRGREEDEGIYHDLLVDVEAAEVEGAADALKQIKAASLGDGGKPQWQAAAWYLERRHGYVAQQRIDNTHSAPDGGPVAIDLSGKSTAELIAILEACGKAGGDSGDAG